MVTSSAGPWRTSGAWWDAGAGDAGRDQGSGFRNQGAWDRDEWDVALADGAVYRIFQDRITARWFIDAVID